MSARRMKILTLAALAGSSSLLSLGLANPAMAQDRGQAAADAGFDIIVTATRQSQLLSRVPVSVSAMTEETLEQKGIKSFEDVARFTPGVDFSSGSNKISIRGISSGAGAGTTGIYLDDTPIQMRGLGFSADDSLPGIFDVERVEVLRGPQGTLFGAGSEGGTVRYITPQPGLQDYSGFARAEVSQTQHGGANYEIGAAVGGPLVVDKIGFRASAWHRRDGGWVDIVTTDSIGPANPRGIVSEKNANNAAQAAPHESLDRHDGVARRPGLPAERRSDHHAFPALPAADGAERQRLFRGHFRSQGACVSQQQPGQKRQQGQILSGDAERAI